MIDGMSIQDATISSLRVENERIRAVNAKLVAACKEIWPFVEADLDGFGDDDPYQKAIGMVRAALAAAKDDFHVARGAIPYDGEPAEKTIRRHRDGTAKEVERG